MMPEHTHTHTYKDTVLNEPKYIIDNQHTSGVALPMSTRNIIVVIQISAWLVLLLAFGIPPPPPKNQLWVWLPPNHIHWYTRILLLAHHMPNFGLIGPLISSWKSKQLHLGVATTKPHPHVVNNAYTFLGGHMPDSSPSF